MSEKVYYRLISLPHMLLLLAVAAVYYAFIEPPLRHSKPRRWVVMVALMVLTGVASALLNHFLFLYHPSWPHTTHTDLYWWGFVLMNPTLLGIMFCTYSPQNTA
ncbi:hypothetical protein [Eisenibacter elegans]|uniref:hypothetical protein n=1 Tax=Eisenibacter elegans TaxID=997 RepID=UPI0013785D57|nr:hypothetical protein [Eisenibacter elegans]